MSKPGSRTSAHEKARIRAEIEDQVAEFLSRGGKIDVVNNGQPQHSGTGSVWHQPDDLSNLAS